MKTIHHATAKKAAALGIEFAVATTGTHYEAKATGHNGAVICRGTDPKQMLTDAAFLLQIFNDAQRLKLYPQQSDLYDAWMVVKGKKVISYGDTAQEAWEKALGGAKTTTKAKADDEGDEGEGEGDEGEGEGDEGEGEGDETEGGKSVVTAKYKQRYKPHRDTNGDSLNEQIAEHVNETVEVKGKMVDRINTDKLRRFAQANDCWRDTYAHLNPGMQRMNVGNRLRAKVRQAGVKGEEFIIQWVG